MQEDTAKYKRTYETGPEIQVLDNDGHSDGKIIKHRAGDLYDLLLCSKETVKPVDEWNEMEINHYKLVVGGRKHRQWRKRLKIKNPESGCCGMHRTRHVATLTSGVKLTGENE